MSRPFPKRDRYDAVVVGAGPGGSLAARDLARSGRSVLVLDRRQEVGAPKRCGEGVPLVGLDRIAVTPHPNWSTSTITGAAFYTPGALVEVDGGGRRDLTGTIVERKVFEKHLAADAIAAGAEYLCKAQVTGLLPGEELDVKIPGRDGDGHSFRKGAAPRAWGGVAFEFLGEPHEVRADVVLGADGVDSSVGRWCGLHTPNSPRSYFSAFQYELAGVRGLRPDWLYFWFGERVAPRGYAWAFPKDHGLWNVGVCIEAVKSRPAARAQDLTDALLAAHPEHFARASPVEINGSGIPMGGTLDHFVLGNVALVGDAAHLAHPLHGGGIDLAAYSGTLAAQAAHEALALRDRGKPPEKWTRRLLRYEARWEAKEGKRMRRLLRLREVMRALSDEDLDLLASVATGEDVVAISGGNWGRLLRILGRNRKALRPVLEKALAARKMTHG